MSGANEDTAATMVQPREFFAGGIHRQGCQGDVSPSAHLGHRLRPLPLRPQEFLDGFHLNKSQER